MSSRDIATTPPMLFPAGKGAAELSVGRPTASSTPGGSTAQPTGRQQGTGHKPAVGEMKHKPLQGAIGARTAEQPWLLTAAAGGRLPLPGVVARAAAALYPPLGQSLTLEILQENPSLAEGGSSMS
ncbi:uncharacterized protein ACIBXB_004413 [Morphnus guianensis]